MSDPVRWSARAPLAKSAGSSGVQRPPPAAADLRPRFSELLRQRKSAEFPSDAALPYSDSALEPVESPAQGHAAAQDEPAPLGPAADAEPAVCEPGLSAQASAAARLSPADQQQIHRLAAMVAHFCNDRAVSDSEGWQVQIELRPEVLPDTTLTLTVSPFWLCLRFAIHDDHSRRLIMTHQQALAEQLEEVLVRRREISIGFD